MALAGALHLWNKWEIQILVLVSFALQVLLLIFARMRRRSISASLNILLWLMYLLAEYTATYDLGHMSIGGLEPAAAVAGERRRQLMAFWAPFLLLHLGGQDTITAYAMEDSQLWLRHLLTFSVQALGAGYVLCKYIGSRGPLVAPATLVFLVGVLKNAERVWALNFSRLEILRRYLDGISIKENDGHYYPTTGELELDDESVLQGAHDLLYISLGQFVDDKIYPSKFQNSGMKLFHEKSKTLEVVEMQLSLMYDIFYTKAAVIHTWYGRCFRAVSLLATAAAFFLFQFQFSRPTVGKDGSYRRADVVVTYVLLAGALVVETASVLRAMGSTWTCAMLKETKQNVLHGMHVSLRRYARIAETRGWPGCIGQLNLLDVDYADGDRIGTASSRPPPAPGGEDKRILGSKMMSFWWRDGGGSRISTATKEKVLQAIQKVVEACEGEEGVMRSYRGQCALNAGTAGILFKDLTWSTSMEFDQSILAWHLATHKFLIRYSSKSTADTDAESLSLVEATRIISNYMMFLFVERPYMLPSPVRPTLHLQARRLLREWGHYRRFMERGTRTPYDHWPLSSGQVLAHGAKLADQLLGKQEESSQQVQGTHKVLAVVFGVWVEMLCYAAHHCSRESHVRQLSNGGEFMTTVWLLATAEFNRVYYSQDNFMEREPGSIWNFLNFVDFEDFIQPVVRSLSPLLSWSPPSMSCVECLPTSCAEMFSLIFMPIRGLIILLKSPWIPDDPANVGICCFTHPYP